ncbi:DUF6265 family protein [uncultured Psychroserpens sp.]|uniref:DUF6265 family protein n=1 Tax=uncultured Psychroserpens sp. TaxID=255436 RepID=UPI00261163BA|nr:DUF6265 family protein [uncultured Psychroserpens sp.]
MSKLDFLKGTWKIENKDTYESWEKKEGLYIGSSYKIVNEEKHITETLSIQKLNEEIIYSALVPSQNNGKTISFTLNMEKDDVLSFENLAHDFPKKIQYKKVNDTKIYVKVLGEDDKGFNYFLIKQGH